MHEVVEGVLQVKLRGVSAYLVVTDDGLVLVDTGLPRTHRTIEQAVTEARRSVGEIRTVLVTHWHTDHTGGLAALRGASGARVVAHRLDTPIITGTRPEPQALLGTLMSLVVGRRSPAPVDEVLEADGAFSVPGFTAVHTPGHTPGHVSYLLDRAGGVLFTGDAAASAKGKVRHAPRLVTDDQQVAATSVAKLGGLAFDVAVFGHGDPITGGAVERFRELAAAA